MKQVKLKDVSLDEVQVLQHELDEFASWQRMGFNFWSEDDFFNALSTVDIALRLYLMMRKKVESDSRKYKVTLKISEAVVLLKCCHWKRSARGDYEAHVAEKYKGLLDQQLKSLNTN